MFKFMKTFSEVQRNWLWVRGKKLGRFPRVVYSFLAVSLPAAWRTKPLKMSLCVDIRCLNKDLIKSADGIVFLLCLKSLFTP